MIMTKASWPRIAAVAVLVSALFLAAIPLGSSPAFAAPAPAPAAVSAPKPPGRPAPATIAPDVTAAVAHGPTDVLVSVDPSAGLDRIRRATRGRFDASTRRAAADQAAASYAEIKRGALTRAGRGVHAKKDFDRLPVQLVPSTRPRRCRPSSPPAACNR